jgi:GTPase involved in cell partitioning and DNA repair
MESKDVFSSVGSSKIESAEEFIKLQERLRKELRELEQQLMREAQKILWQKMATIREKVNNEMQAALSKYREDLLKLEEIKKTDAPDLIKMVEEMARQNLDDKINALKEEMKKGLLS